MTPREWARTLEAAQTRDEADVKRLITQAWMTANWSHATQMPSLESILTPPTEAVELPPEEVERQAAFMTSIADKLRERNAQRDAEGKH